MTRVDRAADIILASFEGLHGGSDSIGGGRVILCENKKERKEILRNCKIFQLRFQS